MCVAIFTPAHVSIAKSVLARAYATNPHGCGLATRGKTQVHIRKGLWSFATLWHHVQRHKHQDRLIHVRFASMGPISAAMCHPFQVGPYALIHNGTLDGFGSARLSDTADFCETLLGPVLDDEPGILRHPTVRQELEALISHSRMALLGPEGLVLLNGHLGSWHQGSWYSQRHFLRVPKDKVTKELFLLT